MCHSNLYPSFRFYTLIYSQAYVYICIICMYLQLCLFIFISWNTYIYEYMNVSFKFIFFFSLLYTYIFTCICVYMHNTYIDLLQSRKHIFITYSYKYTHIYTTLLLPCSTGTRSGEREDLQG